MTHKLCHAAVRRGGACVRRFGLADRDPAASSGLSHPGKLPMAPGGLDSSRAPGFYARRRG